MLYWCPFTVLKDVGIIALCSVALQLALSLIVLHCPGVTPSVQSPVPPVIAIDILRFYAFAGCDIVFAFHRKEKKICNMCAEVSETTLSQCKASLSDHDFQNLQSRCFIINTVH